MKPREICLYYPGLFPQGAEDVRRVRRNVIARLRRSYRLLSYLAQHGYISDSPLLDEGQAPTHAGNGDASSPACLQVSTASRAALRPADERGKLLVPDQR